MTSPELIKGEFINFFFLLLNNFFAAYYSEDLVPFNLN